MLLRAVELVVLCGAAADGASKASSQASSRCCEMRFEERAVATTVSGLAFQQLAYYKDTSKHCTEPRRGIARALSNAAKLDVHIAPTRSAQLLRHKRASAARRRPTNKHHAERSEAITRSAGRQARAQTPARRGDVEGVDKTRITRRVISLCESRSDGVSRRATS